MPSILGHIEDEAHDRLPAEVFVKGFLRAYARHVGVDPDDVVARYRAARGLDPANEAPVAKPASSHRWLLLLALAGLLVLAAASVAVMRSESPAPPSAAQAPSPEAGAVRPPPAPAPVPAKGHVMGIEALAPTWIKIIVDGGELKTYDLQPGDRLELAAQSDFSLLLGDVAGARLTLDGNPVAPAGKPGEVVSLTLP
jgi:hypothetical protein